MEKKLRGNRVKAHGRFVMTKLEESQISGEEKHLGHGECMPTRKELVFEFKRADKRT